KLHHYLESLPAVVKVQSLAITCQLVVDFYGGRLYNFELYVLRRTLSADVTCFLIKPYLSDEHQQARVPLRYTEASPDLRHPELVNFTGMLVQYNNMLQSLFHSQIATIGVVFVAIMFMILVLFRSFKIALIPILPNMLAASIVLGGMGLTGIPLDMMTITIAA